MSFRSREPLRPKRRQSSLAYEGLESRQLLATLTDFDPSTGQLDITLNANNDVAIVRVNGSGEVEVNGSRDMDSGTSGVQTVNPIDVVTLNVAGSRNAKNQGVDLGGDFSISNSSLHDVSVTEVSDVLITGDYVLTGDLTMTMDGAGNSLRDSADSTIRVGGESMLDVGNNGISLTGDVDFFGSVAVSASSNNRVEIVDQNNLSLSAAEVGGDLVLEANGAIVDVPGATISVNGDGVFVADSVTLGDHATDSTNFRRTSFDVSGQVELHEDSNIILGSSTMGSLIAHTSGGIFDGRETQIEINGNALLRGEMSVRLGEHGLDSFNAGSVTIQTNGHANVFEDSDTLFVGDSRALTMDVTSLGDVTDSLDATITTEFATGFVGDNIVLGDSETDTVTLGGVYFWSLGDVSISEDGDLFVIDGKNRADRLSLRSTGSIFDDADAKISVDRLAFFEAQSVTVGESLTDRFHAGSIMFQVSDQFFLREDSGLNIAGNNFAGTVNIGAAGDIMNSTGMRLNVAGLSRLRGSNIDVGNQLGDQVNFGSLVVVASGTGSVSEDSSVVLAGVSSANRLEIESASSISNTNESRINVSGLASFQASTGVNIGNASGDEFNAQSVTGNTAAGNVLISENSALFMAGLNNANAMTLRSEGTIGNAQGAEIFVSRRLTLDAAGLISLGTKVDALSGTESDRVEMGSLVLNTSANATVESQSDVLFVDGSSARNINVVARDGAIDRNIFDQPDASVQAVNSIFLTGMDIVMGDTDLDCLLAGVAINVVSSGHDNVVEGCP